MNELVKKLVDDLNNSNDGDNLVLKFKYSRIHKANKKSRITKEPTPENLQEVIEKSLEQIHIKIHDFDTYIQKFNEQNNIVVEESDKTKREPWFVRVDKKGFIVKHKEKDEYYLRLNKSIDVSSNTTKEYFDQNGNIVDFSKLVDHYFKKPAKKDTPVFAFVMYKFSDIEFENLEVIKNN